MIKRGTKAHKVLVEIVDNPTNIKELASSIGIDTNYARVVVRSMLKDGIKINREGDVVWIKAKDMPKFGTYAHEKIYEYLIEHGSIDNAQIRKLLGNAYGSCNINKAIERLERDFKVKVYGSIEKREGGIGVKVWRLSSDNNEFDEDKELRKFVWLLIASGVAILVVCGLFIWEVL